MNRQHILRCLQELVQWGKGNQKREAYSSEGTKLKDPIFQYE